jgi:hypothetical protein
MNPSSLCHTLTETLAAIKFSCYLLCNENVLIEVKEKQLSLMNYLGDRWSIGEGGCIRVDHFYGSSLVLAHTCGMPPRLKEIVENLAH